MTKEILNRSFYLIIPEKENLEIQLAVCEENLKNLNLKFSRLNGQIMPKINFLTNFGSEAKFNGHFTRTIAVTGYPRLVEPGFLDKIITLNGTFDIALHLEPYPIENTLILLNQELQKQGADLWSQKQKEMINPSLDIKYRDTQNVLENLQKGSEKLFNVSLYITIKSPSLSELEVITKKIESLLNSLLIISCQPKYRMHLGLKSVLPLGVNELNIKRNITTKALSAFFPFTSQFLQADESGILLGLNKNNIPIIKDIFKLYNANGVILASSGSGKSYFTKLMISRLLINGTKVLVIDPQSEYTDLVERFNGQLITISRTSQTIINPLDLMGHDYDEKKLTLMDLMPVMIGQMSEIQKAVLDRALTVIYDQKGINNELKTWRREPPLLADLLNQLKKMSRTATRFENETYRSLINRLEMYVSGVFSFLNRQTCLDFNRQFVCFNIGDMPNQVKPVVMFLILDYVYMKMKRDIERKLLVVDEAWSLLERTEDESYLFRIVKTCRKFNLGLLLITQDVGDLLKSNAGKALLNNSEYTLLLRQKYAIIDQLQDTFNLSLSEREKLLTASAGEGILIISNEHTELKIIASPEEHMVITTNADERLKKEKEQAKEVVTHFEVPEINFGQGFFRKAELKKELVEELLERGYYLSSHFGLNGQSEDYLLKPRNKEGLEHFFLVKKIEEYLQPLVKKVELFETKEADLVFEHKGKEYAIEVETGSGFRPAVLNYKLRHLKKKYGQRWFFVVTNQNYQEKYRKYGPTYTRKEVVKVLDKIINRRN